VSERTWGFNSPLAHWVHGSPRSTLPEDGVSLVLRRERLDEQTTGKLTAVVAGAAQTTPCPAYTYHCITGPALCDGLSRVVCP
jgi:hypothetical protein